MSDVFATYQPPGVYSREETTPLATNVGINPTVVGILGPSLGYRTHTEAVVLVGTTDSRLSKLGIDSDSVVVVGADGVTLAGTEYTLTPGNGADATADTPDDTLDLKRAADSDIADGEQVIVTYNYTDPTYFDVLRATSYDDVTDAFGKPFDATTGEIISPLSLAAKFAFDNGASRIVLLAVEGEPDAVDVDDLNSAYAAMLAQEDVNIVVPLPVGIDGTTLAPADVPQVGTNLKNHVEGAAADGIFRIGILGYETGVTIDPAEAAADIGSKRVMLVHPNRMSYYNAFLSSTVEVAGYYQAAAYAGRLASLPPQYPMTRKAVRGFSNIPSVVLNGMNRSVKDAWSNAGVAVTEPNPTRGLICRHGLSTDPTSVLTREISITRAQDTIITSLMQSFDRADIIGSPIVAETPARIKGICMGVLERMKDADVLVDYSGLSVRQTTIDPTVIEVKFLYAPAYPANYILITYGIDTTTGAIVTAEANETTEGV